MKTIFLTMAAVLAGFGLHAQTNSPPRAANSGASARAGQPPAETRQEKSGAAAQPIPPGTTPAAAPARPAPSNTEARSNVESAKLRQLTEALAAQKPNPKDLERPRTTGLLPSLFRTVKSGNSPLQLINPFAPIGREEKDYGSVRSRVFDDPKTHASPGIDVFSVNF